MTEDHPNRGQFEVTEQLVILEVDGFKFFRGQKSNDFQCVTCLNMMGMVGKHEFGEKEEKLTHKNGIRRIMLQKDCDCPRQKINDIR